MTHPYVNRTVRECVEMGERVRKRETTGEIDRKRESERSFSKQGLTD